MPGITLIGLGPGDSMHLTRQAWDMLINSPEVWALDCHHPVIAQNPGLTNIRFLHDDFSQEHDYSLVIVDRLMELALRPDGVIFALPGHPLAGNSIGSEVARRASEKIITLRIVDGLSFLTPVSSAFELNEWSKVTLIDTLGVIVGHVPSFSPEMPVVVSQLGDIANTAKVKAVLRAVFPDFHPVFLLHTWDNGQIDIENVALAELDASSRIGPLTILYIPPLERGTSFETFQEIIAHLRAPDGCPWDREQTHSTLRKHLLEETYEAIDALDSKDPAKMREEFGDLLLQIVLNAQIGYESGEYTMTDVIKGIHDKIVRRHPHVFGDVRVDGVGDVLQNWEKLKAQERKTNGADKIKGILDGLPAALPALTQAQEFQARAARVGFDWPEIEGVLEKIKEEIDEVRHTTNEMELAAELGDLLFALVNLARWKKVDAESALREASSRFKRRFAYIEENVLNQDKLMSDLSLDEMESLWQMAKKQGL